MGIGQKIRELRQRAGLTQEGLELKIGVTPSAVGNYERDVSFPKEEVLMSLFGALECTPNELLGGSAEVDNEHERGREAVDSCTQAEFDRCQGENEVLIAARNGEPPHKITLKRRGKKTIFDVPDYGGERRRRFTIAHELGHCLLGHVSGFGSAAPAPAQERAADSFAAELLAPLAVLKMCCISSAEELVRICGISRSADEIRFTELLRCDADESDLRMILRFSGFIDRYLQCRQSNFSRVSVYKTY